MVGGDDCEELVGFSVGVLDAGLAGDEGGFGGVDGVCGLCFAGQLVGGYLVLRRVGWLLGGGGGGD